MVRYDFAVGPSDGPQPGALAVVDHWTQVTGLGSLGIYNPRRVRGSTQWSIHAEGRAADLAANAHLRDHLDKADTYCAFLVQHAEVLNIQYLIWNRRSWKSGRGWQRYQGVSAHTDHIHVELNWDGARDVTVAQLEALWAQEEDDLTPEQAQKLHSIQVELRALRGEMDRQYGELSARIDDVHPKVRRTIYNARDSLAGLLRGEVTDTIRSIPDIIASRLRD